MRYVTLCTTMADIIWAHTLVDSLWYLPISAAPGEHDMKP